MKAPSGRFVLRIPPELHRSLAELARQRDKSLNGLCKELLEESVRTSGVALKSAEWEPVIAFLRKRFGGLFLGLVLFGSASRQDAGEPSDVDLLVVVAPEVPLTRDLYRDWDKQRFLAGGRPVNPHFVHPPDPGTAGGIWFEAALDGIVISDEADAVNAILRRLRQAIASGQLRRHLVHGHPYWIRETR